MRYLLVILTLIYSFSALGEKSLKKNKKINIDKKSSKIEWLGQKKIPGKSHRGTLKIKEAMVEFDGKMNPVGGFIIIDMTRIENTDLSGEDSKKLISHLESDDFFDVANHKTAQFKITKFQSLKNNSYNVRGDLTIRGKTNTESFKVKIEKSGKVMVATGQIEFDRVKYGVTYNSESSLLKKAISIPKDRVIKDKIQLTLSLKTLPVEESKKAKTEK